MPQRIQMSRQRPWRAHHPDAVIVARPSKWGNPFWVRYNSGGTWAVLHDGIIYGCYESRAIARNEAVDLFRSAINPAAPKDSLPHYPLIKDMKRELAGKDLCCWCPLDQPCHADVLIELANGATP